MEGEDAVSRGQWAGEVPGAELGGLGGGLAPLSRAGEALQVGLGEGVGLRGGRIYVLELFLCFSRARGLGMGT